MPKPRYRVIEFDRLKMYFSEPYVIDLENTQGSVTVYQPTIGDIVEIGEKKFYSTLNVFIANTTTYRSFLWQIGKDWNEMSDFELWMMLIETIDDDVSKLLFGDLNFKKFDLYKRPIEKDEKVVDEYFLYSEEYDVEITEEVYQHIHQYLQEVFAMKPEEKITSDTMMKKLYIQKDKRQQDIDAIKQKESSSIVSIISACVNHPGFKYNLKQLKEVGVCQFYDSVKRLQTYENTTATLKGLYSGLALSGGKGLKPEDYNFMREM